MDTKKNEVTDKHAILKRNFGYDTFREGQGDIIDALQNKRDALGVMPTGAGKSLCYQIPALMAEGYTLVISPLISLMRDQVLALCANDVAAAYINSSLSEGQVAKALSNAKRGLYKIIYIAPERLLSPSIAALAAAIDISIVAVDEAHCISQWGQDFRPTYLDIPKFIASLAKRPTVAAFTATATPRVREDILKTLELINPLTLVAGFDRPNLYFEVRQPNGKYAALSKYVAENEGSGIIYCSTRKEVEVVTRKLIEDGHDAARYHAGLETQERTKAQDDFLFDRVRLIVATNAFGMGIDKSNVRFVIHYNMPQNVESYYQEAGRAGRDGLPADCILFYGRKDVMTAIYLIDLSENAQERYRNHKLLDLMERYCETDECLRHYMLNYFGERTENDCGNCGNCNIDAFENDITENAQKLLSHIARLNRAGVYRTITQVAAALTGETATDNTLPTYGIMRDSTKKEICAIMRRLKAKGYLENKGDMLVTPEASAVLRGNERVTMRLDRTEGQKPRKKAGQAGRYAVSEALLSKLKALRLEIARGENVPAFVVFSDATLVDMCAKHPRTNAGMLNVSGVGNVKLERYGEAFLRLLNEEEHGAKANTATDVYTPDKLRDSLDISDEPITVSRVADMIGAVLLRYGKGKPTGKKLNELLITAGCLEVLNGQKNPTAKGAEIGITSAYMDNAEGGYNQCYYNAGAQRVCVELVIDSLNDSY